MQRTTPFLGLLRGVRGAAEELDFEVVECQRRFVRGAREDLRVPFDARVDAVEHVRFGHVKLADVRLLVGGTEYLDGSPDMPPPHHSAQRDRGSNARRTEQVVAAAVSVLLTIGSRTFFGGRDIPHSRQGIILGQYADDGLSRAIRGNEGCWELGNSAL